MPKPAVAETQTLSAIPAKERGFRGWRVVGAGGVMQALQASLFLSSYGNYAVYLNDQLGWSKTELSAGYSFSRLESGLMAPVQGWALDRFRMSTIMRFGVVCLAAGLIGFSQVRELWHLFAVLAVVSFGAALSGFLSVTTAVVRWFERNRARALSLSSLGFAIGGMSAPVVVYLMDRLGWRPTVALSGVLCLIVGWPLTKIFGGFPADYGQHVDNVDPATIDREAVRAEGVSDVHLTLKQAARTRAFWMISLGHASALLVVSAVMAHLSLYLTVEQGFSLQRASMVGAVLPFFQMAGMVIGGQLGDQVNKRMLASGAMLGHMAALLMLTYAQSEVLIWLFAPLHGLAWGIRGPLMQALRADYFGATHFGKIMGVSALIVMLGTVGGPLFAGALADTTGSYRTGFTIIAIVAGLGLTFFVLATPPKKLAVIEPQPA